MLLDGHRVINEDDKIFDSLILRRTPGAPLSLSSPSKISVIPNFTVKMYIHEDVSSIQERKSDIDDISSHVFIEGTINIQVQSSDKVQNQPFLLELSDDRNKDNTCFRFNKNVVDMEGDKIIVSIPKETVGQTIVASYASSFNKRGMPILVQSKIIRSGINIGRCMIAVQIRSNLNNDGDIKNITLGVSLPPTVVGKTLEITREKGHFDSLKRIIKWKFNELRRGESLMVGAQVEAISNIYTDELPKFPILLRCQSTEDLIGFTKVNAHKIEGNSAGLKMNKYYSFRLLHRVP